MKERLSGGNEEGGGDENIQEKHSREKGQKGVQVV